MFPWSFLANRSSLPAFADSAIRVFVFCARGGSLTWSRFLAEILDPAPGVHRAAPDEGTPSLGFSVEAPRIENDQRRAADTIEQRKGSIGVPADSANMSDRASKSAIDRRDVTVEATRTSCRA